MHYLCTRIRESDAEKGAIAQLVEHRTENPCVPGSIPGGTTMRRKQMFPLFCLIRYYLIVSCVFLEAMNENHNYCVIMAGGIGSRFWPYSRADRPKQFIDFFGLGKTLLRQTYDRFCQIVPKDHIIISTNVAYTSLVLEQLPELDKDLILHEPAYKRTAPSMALAAYHLRTIDPEACIVMAPIDQFISDERAFRQDILEALDYAAQTPHLVTVGIRPTHPETRYGYIQIDDDSDEIFHKIKTFTEKPQIDFARIFVESGEFYWNTGLFVWKANTIIETMRLLLPDMIAHFDAVFANNPTRDERRTDLYRRYESFPSISVDYAVIEKAPNMYMQVGHYGWVDIGRWEDVYQEADKDTYGNASRYANVEYCNSHNNLVVVPKDKVVVLQDLDGYLVNVTDDVIVICRRDEDDIRKFRNDVMMKYGKKFM